jgi:hypothetical protein
MHVVFIGSFNPIDRIFQPWMSQYLGNRDPFLGNNNQ